ncbi:MAG: DUF488 family protein [Chitinophagales bacterium]
MQTNIIYTIGYGNKRIASFVEILEKFKIQYLIDVRSQPFSKHNSNFNRLELQRYFAKKSTVYAFFGDTLGGKPKDKACYDKNGMVNYEILKLQKSFQTSLERLKTAHRKNLKVALMCACSKPEKCHRTKLIAEELVKDNIAVIHIDEKLNLKQHKDIMLRLRQQKNNLDLFHNA